MYVLMLMRPSEPITKERDLYFKEVPVNHPHDIKKKAKTASVGNGRLGCEENGRGQLNKWRGS
jgi:hypothetical protein